jgi:dipeptidyl-peptidase 4
MSNPSKLFKTTFWMALAFLASTTTASVAAPLDAGGDASRADGTDMADLEQAPPASQPGTNATAPTARVYRDRITPHWFAGNNKFWYRNALENGRSEFLLVDAEAGTRGPAFDHKRLAAAWSKQSGTAVQPDHLPFNTIRYAEDGKSVLFPGKDSDVWRCDLSTYELTKAEGETLRNDATDDNGGRRGRGRRGGNGGGNTAVPNRPISRSPDGNWEAFIRNDNLYLRDVNSKDEYALTTDGATNNSYAKSYERDQDINMEFTLVPPSVPGPDVYWSPDSKHLVALKTKAGTDRRVYYVESSPVDQEQPKLHSYPYLKAGDDVPIIKPHLFDVAAHKETPIDNTLFPNPWSLEDVRWVPDSSRFTFVYNQRGHQVLRIVAVDAGSGEARPIVDEQSKTFIDYSGKYYADYEDKTDEIIWMSERDGWNHLYLYDAKTGQVKNQITKGEWVVRSVERVDADKRQIWFTAGGIHPGQDPYYIHYCRVNFDGTGLTVLTDGDGTHSVAWSPDRRYFIDTYSRVDMAPVNELRRSDDGKLVCALEKGDDSALRATGWRPPEPFVAKGRDGVTDIYGVIYRPEKYSSHKKYAILEDVYAGPHDSFVPKAFSVSGGMQTLANHGFIVVQSDGMGTSNRSKKFQDVCWKNLIDAGFPDRILWIKAAAAKYPYMDLKRVGIYGTSAGGQSALAAVLTHPEFYDAAVADCGCHDNRMDKIWWNEQWMGWPIGPEYAANSNVTYAHNLRGKLLLMVGEDDENVDPATTGQVVNALIKANKNFDLLVMPGRGHGVAGTPYGQRRLVDFFVKNLQESNAKPDALMLTGATP